MSNRPICDVDTPDPWVVAANGRFYLTFTLDNRIEIWSSPTLEDFGSCARSTIWQPPPGSPWSANIWAPELHYLAGRWYVYTCGAPPGVGNPGHRTTVLRCAAGQNDPMAAADWEFLGPLRGMPDQWAIDATVFSPDRTAQSLYCCWSGWPPGDRSDTQQDLFLIRMRSPEEAMPETLVCISQATLPWERPDGGAPRRQRGPDLGRRRRRVSWHRVLCPRQLDQRVPPGAPGSRRAEPARSCGLGQEADAIAGQPSGMPRSIRAWPCQLSAESSQLPECLLHLSRNCGVRSGVGESKGEGSGARGSLFRPACDRDMLFWPGTSLGPSWYRGRPT
ncbi:hypothetical protein MCOR17_008077 [Pyricularia oryzae]|nr:hypothetical protein MCOR17_008077 [Pyricularia oryzae]